MNTTNEMTEKDCNLNIKGIPPEKLDTYKLAMFPVMMQAIYNAREVLNAIQLERGGAKFIEVYDCYATRPTFEDLELVLDAFKSIGISPRFMRERRNEKRRNWWQLRHVKENEAQRIEELFNPDATEYDEQVRFIKDEFKRTLDYYRNQIKELKDKIATLAGINGSLKQDVQKLKSKTQNSDGIVMDKSGMPDYQKNFYTLGRKVLKALRHISTHLRHATNIKENPDEQNRQMHLALGMDSLKHLLDNLKKYERYYDVVTPPKDAPSNDPIDKLPQPMI